MIKNKHLN